MGPGPVIRAIAIALLASGCTTGGITSPPPISKIQSRELPQAIVTDRIVRQLSDILIGTPAGKQGVAPVRPLEDVWFWTTPRATEAPGVCRSDRVIFEFSPVRQRDEGADTPTRVSGVTASSRYILLEAPPPGPPEYLTEAGRSILEQKCAGVAPETHDTVSARSATSAREGARLFAEMRTLDVADESIFVFGCNPESVCTGEKTAFRELVFANVGDIDRCDPLPPPSGSWTCTRFKAWDFTIDIQTRMTSGGDEISRVNVNREIVLWHERID